MKTPLTKSIPFQNIPNGASSSAYVEKLISFLEQTLPDFSHEKVLQKESSENALTEALYKYLTRKARAEGHPFEFQPEKSQKMPKGHDKRVDMAVRINTCDIDMEVIYCIEAKKLPTDSPGGAREKEYVSGQTGGIERFKNEAHGKDDAGRLLPRNGMVAYVTKQGLQHWHKQINQWILNEKWPQNETLIPNYFSPIGMLTSTHLRVSGDKMQLTHFWVII